MAVTVGTDVNQLVADVDTYWSDRNNVDWAALTTADKEVNMRKAADWLERTFQWRGVRKTQTQRLGWPRDQAYDNDGYLVGETEAPLVVKEAEAIVADLFRQGIYDMVGIVTDDEAAIKRQKVDVIEVEYDNAYRIRGAAIVSHVILLLRGVTVGNTLLRA